MQSTRQDILDLLIQRRHATVEDLAECLGLTSMTIRHHLNVLQAHGLVTTARARRLQTVGRPRLVYTLTEAGEDLFPQRYGDLAGYLVDEVKDSLGATSAREIFERIAERIAAGAPQPVPGQGFEARLDQVTRYLRSLGFIASWERREEGYLFSNVNCPYRRVAQDHAEVCAMDASLLTRLLGVEPRQIRRQRDGAATCSCVLVPPGA